MPGIASSKPGGSPPKNISRELRAGAARVSVMATAVPTHTRMLPPTKAAGFWCTQPSRTVLKAGGRTNPLPLHLFFAACTLRITRPPRASACTPASPTLPHPARRHLTPRATDLGDASLRCNKADRSRGGGGGARVRPAQWPQSDSCYPSVRHHTCFNHLFGLRPGVAPLFKKPFRQEKFFVDAPKSGWMFFCFLTRRRGAGRRPCNKACSAYRRSASATRVRARVARICRARPRVALLGYFRSLCVGEPSC